MMLPRNCDVCALDAKTSPATHVATGEDRTQWLECSEHPTSKGPSGSPRARREPVESWMERAQRAIDTVEGKAPTEPAPGQQLGSRLDPPVRKLSRMQAAMVDRISECVIGELQQSKPLQRLVLEITELVVAETIDALEETGFCSYDFHVSTVDDDDFVNGDICSYCEKPRSEHRAVLVHPKG